MQLADREAQWRADATIAAPRSPDCPGAWQAALAAATEAGILPAWVITITMRDY